MDLITNVLIAVSTAIVEPIHLIMLIILGAIFYTRNTKIVKMQKMTIGEKLNSPLELTLSQIVLGIVAGVIGSIILALLGVTFGKNSGIEIMFMASILLLFYRKRFICFAYSGSLIAIISIIMGVISEYTGVEPFISVSILSIMTFIGVLHIIEGLLVMIDGSRGAIPVFTKKEGKIIGGFSLNRYWALPICMLILFSGQIYGNEVLTEAPSWWSSINKELSLTVLATSLIACIPFYGILGYSEVTFTKEKNTKSLWSGLYIIIYGISVVAVAQLANLGLVGQVIAVIYTPIAHEALLKYKKNTEQKGDYLYVSDDEGISILEVAPTSPAFEAGIRRGDKILAINGEPINNEGEIFKVVRDTIFKIPIRIKTTSGEITEYFVQPRNKRLGMLLVPKMVKEEDVVGVDGKEFKKILEELRNKK